MFRSQLQKFNETEQKILTLVYASQIPYDYLSESDMNEGLIDWFKKIGMNIEKNPSLFDYLDSFVSGVGTIVLAAIQGDTAKIKAQAQRFDVEELIDFIDLLDNITLGIISSPLALIQAVTGWDIMSGVRNSLKTAKKITKSIKDALSTVKANIQKIMDPNQAKPVMSAIATIDGSIPDPESIVTKGK